MAEPELPTAGTPRVVALAASAGGLSAYLKLLAALPADFPAAIVLVQHLDPNHASLMAEILGRRIRLRSRQAEDGERLQAGVVYVAPPDRHLLVNPDGTLSLTRTALVHFVRPSADLSLRIRRRSQRDRAVAVVLTGTGTDGASGLAAVKAAGGITIAQDEGSSEHFGMPQAAIRTGCVDFVLPLPEIAPKLIALDAIRRRRRMSQEPDDQNREDSHEVRSKPCWTISDATAASTSPATSEPA